MRNDRPAGAEPLVTDGNRRPTAGTSRTDNGQEDQTP